jgi:hypothetical protein
MAVMAAESAGQAPKGTEERFWTVIILPAIVSTYAWKATD